MTFAVDENGFITAGQELPDGSADLFETDPEAVADVIGQSGYELPVSAGDAVPASGAYAAYDDVAAMSDGIMLLASDSAAANGYLSSTILDLMDRIVDGYGSDYEYLGFRTSQDDSYSAVLYIGRMVPVPGIWYLLRVMLSRLLLPVLAVIMIMFLILTYRLFLTLQFLWLPGLLCIRTACLAARLLAAVLCRISRLLVLPWFFLLLFWLLFF